ncbi:MAG: hypothetical protein WC755_01600 [Candidatus Woesearchaeota archaeon]|jgi:hypothetical protein
MILISKILEKIYSNDLFSTHPINNNLNNSSLTDIICSYSQVEEEAQFISNCVTGRDLEIKRIFVVSQQEFANYVRRFGLTGYETGVYDRKEKLSLIRGDNSNRLTCLMHIGHENAHARYCLPDHEEEIVAYSDQLKWYDVLLGKTETEFKKYIFDAIKQIEMGYMTGDFFMDVLPLTLDLRHKNALLSLKELKTKEKIKI